MPNVMRLHPLVAGSGMLVASLMLAKGLTDTPYGALDLMIGQAAVVQGSGTTESGLALLAVSCLMLIVGLRAVRAPVSGWPERLMLAWTGSLSYAVLVPGTAFGDALLVAGLVGLAGATALMARRFSVDERWRPVARPMEWLALGAGGALVVLTYAVLPGHHVMIGLVEWALLGIEVAALAVPVAHLARITWSGAVRREWAPAKTSTRFPVLNGAPSGRGMASAATLTTENTPVGGERRGALLTRH